MQGSYKDCAHLGIPAPADAADYEQQDPVAFLVVGAVNEPSPSYAHDLVCEQRTQEGAPTGSARPCTSIGWGPSIWIDVTDAPH